MYRFLELQTNINKLYYVKLRKTQIKGNEKADKAAIKQAIYIRNDHYKTTLYRLILDHQESQKL